MESIVAACRTISDFHIQVSRYAAVPSSTSAPSSSLSSESAGGSGRLDSLVRVAPDPEDGIPRVFHSEVLVADITVSTPLPPPLVMHSPIARGSITEDGIKHDSRQLLAAESKLGDPIQSWSELLDRRLIAAVFRENVAPASLDGARPVSSTGTPPSLTPPPAGVESSPAPKPQRPVEEEGEKFTPPSSSKFLAEKEPSLSLTEVSSSSFLNVSSKVAAPRPSRSGAEDLTLPTLAKGLTRKSDKVGTVLCLEATPAEPISSDADATLIADGSLTTSEDVLGPRIARTFRVVFPAKPSWTASTRELNRSSSFVSPSAATEVASAENTTSAPLSSSTLVNYRIGLWLTNPPDLVTIGKTFFTDVNYTCKLENPLELVSRARTLPTGHVLFIVTVVHARGAKYSLSIDSCDVGMESTYAEAWVGSGRAPSPTPVGSAADGSVSGPAIPQKPNGTMAPIHAHSSHTRSQFAVVQPMSSCKPEREQELQNVRELIPVAKCAVPNRLLHPDESLNLCFELDIRRLWMKPESLLFLSQVRFSTPIILHFSCPALSASKLYQTVDLSWRGVFEPPYASGQGQ
jgi:hypothetical protein